MATPSTIQKLSYSAPDSRRFNLQIVRGRVEPEDVANLWQEISDLHADVAIIRITAASTSAMRTYKGPRAQLIHADTLVYYSASLASTNAKAFGDSEYCYREANKRDVPTLTTLVEEIFTGYQNHYHANPLFSAADIAAGYAEWAAGHLVNPGNFRTWVACDNEDLVGFICSSFDASTGTAEIILNGVARAYEGKGIYSNLVRRAKEHFTSTGIRSIRVSTQVANFAVQRVWVREGFRLVEAYDTWHINAMLASKRNATSLDFSQE